MRILITNDDGIGAPGIYVLEKIAAQLSDDIWIVAPAEEQSGAGHSLTLTRPVRLRKHAERRRLVQPRSAVGCAHAVGHERMVHEPAIRVGKKAEEVCIGAQRHRSGS